MQRKDKSEGQIRIVFSFECHVKGMPFKMTFKGKTQVIVHIFILILLAKNRFFFKENVLFLLHFQNIFSYIKMGLYAAKVVVQNEWLKCSWYNFWVSEVWQIIIHIFISCFFARKIKTKWYKLYSIWLMKTWNLNHHNQKGEMIFFIYWILSVDRLALLSVYMNICYLYMNYSS